ncbi:MAG: COG2426 family protein, partial [Candidatus Margulisiibacteriota bacterium]
MTLPSQLVIFLTAAVPILEVRASVPLGIAAFRLAPFQTIILSIAGSILPIFPLLWCLNNLTDYLRKVSIIDRFFGWLFARTRAKSKLIEDLELIGLTLFIAIPLPGTGVWTGTIAA